MRALFPGRRTVLAATTAFLLGFPAAAPAFTTDVSPTRTVVNFPIAAGEDAAVAFDVRRDGGAPQTLARLRANLVSLDETERNLVLRVPGASVALGPALSPGVWSRIAIRAGDGAVTATIDGVSTSLPLTAVAERMVQLGDLRVGDAGGPFSFDNVVTGNAATRPPAPAAAPALFSPDGPWNARLAPDAALDPASPAMQDWLMEQVRLETAARTGPWLATSRCAPRIYTVGPDQPRVRVTLDDGTLLYRRTLQDAFAAVPLPSDAQPAPCSDGNLALYQPSTDSTWDFFRLRLEADGWHAAWGGAMNNVSTSPGYYREDSWPGAQTNWGATATSLPILAGPIRADELVAGDIPHAMTIHLAEARRGWQAWPAQRNDGRSDDPRSIPEGAHLRLDPALDLEALNLPPVVLTIARAAQRYGMIVRDTTQNAIKFDAQDPVNLPYNPYPALFEGRSPFWLMQQFPWDRVQILKMDLQAYTPR